MKKTVCIIFALLIIILASACSAENGEEDKGTQGEETTEASGKTVITPSEAEASFVLPYSEADGFNPYKAKAQMNIKISSLIYDGLYKLDEEFNPREVIAEKAEINGESVTVSLKETVKFTDSSSLNADDVVCSFNEAKKSGYYSLPLENISEAVLIDRFKVKFLLSHPDKFALNVLTFPIFKYGEGEKEAPLGSGRYYLSSDKLVYNKNHISGETPQIKTITLRSLKKSTNYLEALQIGNISFAFTDLSDSTVPRAVARSFPVTLNNLVYLGINSENERLDRAVREAINMASDKEAVVQQAYHGYAVRAESPFNPEWAQSKQKESIFNQASAVELLEKNDCKYSSEESTCRRNRDGKYLAFKIIVPKGNEFRTDAANIIAKNLAQVGINAEVRELSFDVYKEKIKEKDFDLYLGEMKICENMSLSPFFTKSGEAHYGINLKSKIIADYSELLKSKKSVFEFEKEFSKQCPFIPLCYRKGISFTANTLSDNVKSLSGDVFYNIAEWKMTK